MDDKTPLYLSFNDIKEITDDFLLQYNPNETLPVPIEKIAEFKLGIQLIPIPKLKSTFHIDGFIDSSFSQVTIDDEIFNNCEERARFTIAHEIGHRILHEKHYKQKKFNSIDEYMQFQETILDKNHSILERQANSFAGCVLVPGNKLKEEIDNVKKKDKNDFYPIAPLEKLPEIFKVSSAVILIQIQKEGLSIKKLI